MQNNTKKKQSTSLINSLYGNYNVVSKKSLAYKIYADLIRTVSEDEKLVKLFERLIVENVKIPLQNEIRKKIKKLIKEKIHETEISVSALIKASSAYEGDFDKLHLHIEKYICIVLGDLKNEEEKLEKNDSSLKFI